MFSIQHHPSRIVRVRVRVRESVWCGDVFSEFYLVALETQMKNRASARPSGLLSYERDVEKSANSWRRKSKKKCEIFTDFSLMVHAEPGVYV